MQPFEWVHIRHFKESENWGDPLKLDFGLVWLLDSFREHVGKPMIVVCATQGKHVKDSMHYVGKAVDIVVDADEMSPLDIMLIAFRFPFTGFGVYPRARYAEFIRPLGLHLDVRPVTALPRGITQAQWIGVPDAKGKNEYLSLNQENLKKYGLI
jgi:uncharacterized protein YcbK (DUF882 family)